MHTLFVHAAEFHTAVVLRKGALDSMPFWGDRRLPWLSAVESVRSSPATVVLFAWGSPPEFFFLCCEANNNADIKTEFTSKCCGVWTAEQAAKWALMRGLAGRKNGVSCPLTYLFLFLGWWWGSFLNGSSSVGVRCAIDRSWSHRLFAGLF